MNGEIKIILGDCMDLLRETPDKYFDLAIVDPPYGANDAIGMSKSKGHAANRTNYRQFENIEPAIEYFEELRRISKDQIVWGGNFFGLKGGIIVWNKNGTAFGEAEVAVCSTHKSVRIFEYTWNGMLQQNMKDKEQRIHPTQKPVALYEYCLKNYAKEGFKILDTHLGSGSHAIAIDNMNTQHGMNLSLTATEIDKDYYEASLKRLANHQKQLKLI